MTFNLFYADDSIAEIEALMNRRENWFDIGNNPRLDLGVATVKLLLNNLTGE